MNLIERYWIVERDVSLQGGGVYVYFTFTDNIVLFPKIPKA